jgi:hypothetical protein
MIRSLLIKIVNTKWMLVRKIGNGSRRIGNKFKENWN